MDALATGFAPKEAMMPMRRAAAVWLSDMPLKDRQAFNYDVADIFGSNGRVVGAVTFTVANLILWTRADSPTLLQIWAVFGA